MLWWIKETLFLIFWFSTLAYGPFSPRERMLLSEVVITQRYWAYFDRKSLRSWVQIFIFVSLLGSWSQEHYLSSLHNGRIRYQEARTYQIFPNIQTWAFLVAHSALVHHFSQNHSQDLVHTIPSLRGLRTGLPDSCVGLKALESSYQQHSRAVIFILSDPTCVNKRKTMGSF